MSSVPGAKFDAASVVRKSVSNTRRDNARHVLTQRVGFVRLDKNENLVPIDDASLAALRDGLTQEVLSSYPDLESAYRRLSAMAGVNQNQIFLASGSDQAISALFDTCIDPGDHVVLHRPCYFMCEVYARKAGADISWIPVTREGLVDTDAMLRAVRPSTKLVIVEDPVGLLGTLSAESDLRALAHALCDRNVMLAIDEAYLYVRRDRSPYLDLVQSPGNVILFHTLSKAHGLAGARIGFAIGHSAIIDRVSRVRPLYEIGGLQAWSVNWCMDQPHILSDFRAQQATARQFLLPKLDQLGVEYRDTTANFILIRLPRFLSSVSLFAELAERRILVREISNIDVFEGWTRITIQSEGCCRVLIFALADILDSLGVGPVTPPEKPPQRRQEHDV